MDVEPKIGGKPPKWMLKIMVPNPIFEWMIWGVFPLFLVQHPYLSSDSEILTSSTEVDGVQDPIGYKLTMASWRIVEFFFFKGRNMKEPKQHLFCFGVCFLQRETEQTCEKRVFILFLFYFFLINTSHMLHLCNGIFESKQKGVCFFFRCT